MKNLKKLFAIVLCLIICLSLCSCNFIDNMREKQAYSDDKGNIIYKDKTYKLLSECSYFNPDFSKNNTIYLTEKDVPVLLSRAYGYNRKISNDELFIRETVYNDNYGTGGYLYYAREDVYEAYEEKITMYTYFDGYAFSYTAYETNTEGNSNNYPKTLTKYKMLDDEVTEVLSFLFDYGGDSYITGVEDIYNYYITDIYQISKDTNFKKLCGSIYDTPYGIYLTSNDQYGGTKYHKISTIYDKALRKIIDDFKSLDKRNSPPIDTFTSQSGNNEGSDYTF